MAFAPLYHTLRWRRGGVNKFFHHSYKQKITKLVPKLTRTQLLSITQKMKAVYHRQADLKWCSKRISHGLKMDYCRTGFRMNQIGKVRNILFLFPSATKNIYKCIPSFFVHLLHHQTLFFLFSLLFIYIFCMFLFSLRSNVELRQRRTRRMKVKLRHKCL